MPYDGANWRAPALRVDVEQIDERTCLIAPHGELDVSTCDAFSVAIEKAVDGTATRVAVDLAGVSFLDSTAMAALAEWRDRIVAQGGAFAVAAADSYQRRLFQITELIERLRVESSRADALAVLAA